MGNTVYVHLKCMSGYFYFILWGLLIYNGLAIICNIISDLHLFNNISHPLVWTLRFPRVHDKFGL